MKKKQFVLVLVLVLMLSACGSEKESEAADTVVVPVATEPVVSVVTEVTPTPTPAPTLAPTPAPAPAAALPRITKDPGSEKVPVNGKCQFVTRYENAELAEWHFVSPDGTRDLDYAQAEKEFPSLKIINGFTKDMSLENIPAELDGWQVYCRFSNSAGSVNTKTALITVEQSAGFEGRWAEEIAGRCQITFSYRAEGSYNVDIRWSNSAFECCYWEMTAHASPDGDMDYSDGHYWVETYTDETNYTVSDESFGGIGYFFIRDGKLHWYDSVQSRETVLIRA